MRNFQSARKRKIIYSPVFLVGLCALLTALGFSTFKMYQRSRLAVQQKNAANSQLRELEERREALEKEIKMFESQSGLEEKIREKFDVAMPGENVLKIMDKSPENDKIDNEEENMGFFGKVWNKDYAALSWARRKQLVVLAVIITAVLIAAFFFFFSGSGTCFDDKKNNGEEAADCGGPCESCVGETKMPITAWSKVFKLKEGVYEAAALVDNPNIFAGLRDFNYQFKIYDDKNVLLAVEDGKSFLNPDERFVFFTTGIETNRKPQKAFIEITGGLDWKRIEREKPQIVVSGKNFLNEPFPRLAVNISNKSFFPVKDIEAVAVLYGGDGNAMAASRTKIDLIQQNSSKGAVFTWPEKFEKEPASSEVFLRADLTHDN